MRHRVAMMMRSGHWQAMRSMRWLLLPWLVLVYTWGTLALGMSAWLYDGTRDMTLFTVLFLLHGLLYSLSLLLPPRGRWQIAYACVQGLMVVTISVVLFSWTVTLGLYLALVIDAVALLQRPRPVLIAVSGDLALFILTYLVRFYQGTSYSDSIPALLFVAGVAPLVVLYLQRAQAYERSQALLSDLESAHAQLAASAARIEALTLLAERRRIARELHDTVTQGLAGVIMQLEAADARLADQHPQRAREILQQAMGRARAAFTAARCAIEDLRDEEVSPADLLAVAHEEIARFSLATGITCASDLAGLVELPVRLHDPVRRVIGEGLANIARHADAGHAWIRVARRDGVVEVEIRDDGVGFDPATAAARGHYGLVGLRERARLAGGVLEVTSRPGQGAALQVVLPCPSGAGDTGPMGRAEQRTGRNGEGDPRRRRR